MASNWLKASPVPSALLALLLTGCVALDRGQVQFDGLANCRKQSAAGLLAAQEKLGPLSETQILACALDNLRMDKDPLLLRSALGSQVCLSLAEREGDPDRREKLAAEGVKFAETALASGGGEDGAVHYYLSANLGLAVREHIASALDNLGRLEAEMKKAVDLNPDIDGGGPLRLLGALYLKAPAWPQGIGDRDKALDLLGRAVKRHPRHPLNHLFHAQALWDADDDASVPAVKAELELGTRLLAEGRWGYSKKSWQKEFDEFRQELAESGVELDSAKAEDGQ